GADVEVGVVEQVHGDRAAGDVGDGQPVDHHTAGRTRCVAVEVHHRAEQAAGLHVGPVAVGVVGGGDGAHQGADGAERGLVRVAGDAEVPAIGIHVVGAERVSHQVAARRSL